MYIAQNREFQVTNQNPVCLSRAAALAALEVEFFDGKAEHDGEEESPPKDSNGVELEKALLDSIVILQVLIQCFGLSSSAWYHNLGADITELRVR